MCNSDDAVRSTRNRELLYIPETRDSLDAALHSWRRDQESRSFRMQHGVVNRIGVNHHIIAAEVDLEAVQAAWGRTIYELAINIVVRTMTWTFETQAVIAERHRTTQVNTLLIECDPIGAIGIL